MGGWIGTEVGGAINDSIQGGVETVGDVIDDAIEWGDAIDTVTDLF